MQHPRICDGDKSSGVVMSPDTELGWTLMSSARKYLPRRNINNVPAKRSLFVNYTVCGGLKVSIELNVM